MRVIARTVVVLSGLLAAACVPETDASLSKPGAEPLDKRVVGTWFANARSGMEQITLNIQRGEDDNTYAVTWIQFLPPQEVTKEDKPVVWLRYVGHTTKLDGQHYINLRLVHAAWPRPVPKRMVVRYWVGKDDRLTMSLMDNGVVKGAINSGVLKGKLPKDHRGFIRITSDRKALVAFIREVGPDRVFRGRSKPMRRMPVTQ